MAGNFLIYRIRNLINWKDYIGQTVRTLEQRKIKHSHDALQNKTNTAIHHAIRKYGIKNFEFSEICRCESKKQMDKVEKFCILYFKTKSPNGYNLTDGGEGVQGRKVSEQELARMRTFRHSEETKAKFRLRRDSEEQIEKKRQRATGVKQSEETREKKRRSMIGRKFSEEWLAKISIALTGRKMSEEFRIKCRLRQLGKKPSENTRAKMKAAQLLRWQRKKEISEIERIENGR